MLISQNMVDRLNEQINNEQYSAHLYLAMAAAFEKMALRIFAKYYYKQAGEETEHAMKLFKFVVDVGGDVELKAIAEPRRQYDSVADIVQAALEHEVKVTDQIKALAAAAEDEKDQITRSFLTWYLDEQVEEVSSAQEMVDIVRLTPSQMMLALENRVYRMLEG